MKAQVIDIKNKNVKILLSNNKTILVSKKNLNFKYSIGDYVEVRKENKKITFSPMKQKKPRLHMILLLSSVIIAICVGLYFPLSTFLRGENQSESAEKETVEQELSSCIDSALKSNAFDTSKYFDEKIKCYETYRTSDSSAKIQEAKESKEKALLSNCLANAESDNYVSKEEIESAKASGIYPTELLKRYVSKYNAEISCYMNTENPEKYNDAIAEIQAKVAEGEKLINNGNIYSEPSQTIEYPADHNYYAPTPEEVTPTQPAPTCDDYHAQYYSTYQKDIKETKQYYDSAITNAYNSCNSFSGCPAAGNLERERDLEIAKIKNHYKTSMGIMGCDPSIYVDF